MSFQDKISAARAAILRSFECETGEYIDAEESIFSDEMMALVVDLGLELA